MKVLLTILIVLIVVSYLYYSAATQLVFAFGGINFTAGAPQALITVTNPTGLSFPIPPLNLGVYDGAGNYLGTVTTPAWQTIPPNTIINLTADVHPTSTNLLSTALALFNTSGQSATQFEFKGSLPTQFGNVPIDITESI